MYQPNPKRLRDWLSVPKSNGYESLHITVLGPENKWVEVQIRTERMDDIAEHGLAAHWRYKGIKSGGQMDEWLANIRPPSRPATTAGHGSVPMSLQPDEIYVFTPKGDLFKFPAGATVLDFAYRIHSKIGNTLRRRTRQRQGGAMRQELHSGDTVEVSRRTTRARSATG
jgi:guanosine-3',5'-bis(diphosphate) 3'-pyrophosphohydrolase